MLAEETWSVRRLASRTGMPQTSCRRLIAELEAADVRVTEWPLDRAMIGVKAYLGGHSVEAVRLVGLQPFIGSSSWLVSGDRSARVFSTLLQATAYIEEHPDGTYHLSPVGTMGLEVA